MADKFFLKNPYLRELKARIKTKEYSNTHFYLTLDRTIFYPHLSGGQPRDYGKINGFKVVDVYEENNEIIHVLNDNPLEDQAYLSIDWNRRFDHMQQHTGQHILSASFSKILNGRTLSFHLGKEISTIDIDLTTLNVDDIERVECFANEIIFSNFDIKNYIIEKEQVPQLPLRKSPSVEENIRIVEIDGIDYSPCCGTHHRHTGEVGMIKILKWENYKGFTRVSFICGHRALKDYSRKNHTIQGLSELLSVEKDTTLHAVQRLYDANKQYIKQINDLQDHLNGFKARDLYRDGFDYKGTKIIAQIFDELDFQGIRHIASHLINHHKGVLVVFGISSKDKGQIIMGRSNDLTINMKTIFQSVIHHIQGKGGGNPQMVQGGGPGTEHLETCLQEALAILREAIDAKELDTKEA